MSHGAIPPLRGVSHAVLKALAALLNTEGGALLFDVADDGSIVGIEHRMRLMPTTGSGAAS